MQTGTWNSIRNRNYTNLLKSSLAFNGDNGSITRMIQSFATHMNYNYKKKYFVSFIVNHENLRVNNLVNISDWFPSVALSWDISRETVLSQLNWLNQCSLFANWGIAGNYPVNAVAGDFYTNYQYYFPDSVYSGKTVSQFANHYLKSEKSDEYNVGNTLRLFNNKISLSTDYYYKINKNLIIMQDIPYYYEGGKMMLNIGKILNKGYEFNLELEPVNTTNFIWNSAFIVSFSQQKVTSVGDQKQLIFYSNDDLVPEFIINENEAAGNIIGYKYLGIWTSKDNNTNNKHIIQHLGSKFFKNDTTTNYLNDNDRVILGKSMPDCTWSWSNTFVYKNFSIYFLWYGVAGVSKFNSTKAATYMACTNRGINNFILQANRKALEDTFFYQSSYFVENSSFIRLKQITFSYLIPKKVIKYGELKLSVSFENFLTFTRYSGYDPEASIYTDNSFSDFAVDRGAYPNTRAVYFTIKFEM